MEINRGHKIMELMSLPEEMERLKNFHGHLGPWAVVGYRMGQAARKKFEGKLWVVVYTGTRPPMSCLIDGVQFTSCCTMGKGNIKIKDDNLAMGMFYDEKLILEIRLNDRWRRKIDSETTKENEEEISMEVFQAKDEDLFRMTKAESLVEERIVKL
jgi:formylmethanofuran dehydrogenase subunit E